MNQNIIGVIEGAEEDIPEVVKTMMENPGIYIGFEEGSNTYVPLFSHKGTIYSMTVDEPLNPKRFVNGTTIAGPLQPK